VLWTGSAALLLALLLHSPFLKLQIPSFRSLNDGECSADWYNFQESVAHLQLLEEEVLESHKNLVDSMEHWMNQDISLLAMSNEVDYDQDGESSMLTFLHNSGYTGIRGILCIFRSSLSNYKTYQLKVSKCLFFGRFN
jgi:hypothetical protein